MIWGSEDEWSKGRFPEKKLQFFWNFSNIQNDSLSNFFWITAEYLLCGSCIQPKKQFKVQIIGILDEMDKI